MVARRVSWDPQYLNGSVPRPPAVDWDGLGHFLHPEAAAQLVLMSRDFEAVFGHPILTSETDRTIAEQVRLFNLYRSGQGFPAAEPGSSSHGECVAIDIYSFVYRNTSSSAEHRWLRENGPAYGWDWYLVGQPSGEPWHFNYRFGLRTIIAPAWGTTTEEAPIPEEEETMDKYCVVARVNWNTFEKSSGFQTSDSNVFLINLAEGTYRWLPSEEAIHLHTKPKEEGGFGIPYRDGTSSAQVLIGLTNIFNKEQWSAPKSE